RAEMKTLRAVSSLIGARTPPTGAPSRSQRSDRSCSDSGVRISSRVRLVIGIPRSRVMGAIPGRPGCADPLFAFARQFDAGTVSDRVNEVVGGHPREHLLLRNPLQQPALRPPPCDLRRGLPRPPLTEEVARALVDAEKVVARILRQFDSVDQA